MSSGNISLVSADKAKIHYTSFPAVAYSTA